MKENKSKLFIPFPLRSGFSDCLGLNESRLQDPKFDPVVKFVFSTFSLSDSERIYPQPLNIAQFDCPLPIKSNHTVFQRLIDVIAVENAYLRHCTDSKYIKRKSLAQLEIALKWELKFIGFRFLMQIRSEREATRCSK